MNAPVYLRMTTANNGLIGLPPVWTPMPSTALAYPSQEPYMECISTFSAVVNHTFHFTVFTALLFKAM
jgi:hypothetical protein